MVSSFSGTAMYSTRESNNKVSTCPCTVGTGDQKYDELKWESSIISAIEKQHTSKHPAAVRRSDSRKPDLAKFSCVFPASSMGHSY